jgi:hypothetical protein
MMMLVADVPVVPLTQKVVFLAYGNNGSLIFQ